MSPDHTYWSDVETIFEAVADLDTASRAAALDARCGDRQELRAEIEALLEADARAEGFSNATVAFTDEPGPDPPPGVGSTIGPFELVAKIGAGGMGTIYLAERADGGFAQQVAVKIIGTPVSHAGAARRFRAERQILASLRHPHIVSLMDGGVTPDGHAYLVMEYVDGVPIATYCTGHALSLTDRLQLFRDVCAAVHYAHRHGVVHRDLKPANILVAPDGAPKVLDFGVAKMLDESLPGGGNATSIGIGPLTPNYASPEQLRGVTLTTSSDVYALGVLLYELTTGVRPYETDGKSLDEMLRIVIDAEHPRPSSRTERLDTPLPYDRTRALKGDLDAIVLRAMAKQPEHRYGSAEELSEDVGRFIAGAPVVAREPSFGYVMRKLAGRHKAAFVSAGVALVFILGALIVALWQAQVATAERQRAEQRFGEVRQLANALIFEIHDAVAPLAGSTPVRRTIVERALGYLERLANEARGNADLQIELARAYIRIGRVQGLPGTANLGDREGAIQSFRKAQTLVEPLARLPNQALESVEQYVEATRRLSEVLLPKVEQRDEAGREAQKALAVASAFHRQRPADVKARNLLASSSFTAAMAAPASAQISDWQRTGGLYNALLADDPDNPDNQRNAALVDKYLGTQYQLRGDLTQALHHYQRALSLDEKRLAQAPSMRGTQLDVAIALGNVAGILWSQGSPEAVPLFERSLSIRQALADSDPQDVFARSRVAFTHEVLARLLLQQRMLPRALEHAHRAIDLYEFLEGNRMSNFEVGQALLTFGAIQAEVGNQVEACAAYGRSFAYFKEVAPKDLEARGVHSIQDIASRAARCGTKAAQDWLAREGRATPARP
jgi:eukaryotic-like serine/threonine-protein kinase